MPRDVAVESERAVPTAQVAAPVPAPRGLAGRLRALQRSAGNRAVAGLARRVLARDEWSPDYKQRKARGNMTFETYKAFIGTDPNAPAIKPASEWGGTKLPVIRLTRIELGKIIEPEGKASDADLAAHNKRLDDYLDYINDAFETMGIDTVESQSAYLAHAAESGSFSKMTEADAKQPYAPFIGRGPIQVTYEAGYVQALAYLEKRAEQLDVPAGKAGTATAKRANELAAKAREAAAAIKRNIKDAANPKYAFLFSAAFMHNVKGVRRSAELTGKAEPSFAGNAAEDAWVTGQSESFANSESLAPGRIAEAEKKRDAALAAGDNPEATKQQKVIDQQRRLQTLLPSYKRGARIKAAIYKRAHDVLTKKVAAGAPATPQPDGAPPMPAEPTPAARPAPAPAPAPGPDPAKRPQRVLVDVHVIKTEDWTGADEVYVRITGPGGTTPPTPIRKLNDGERFTFALPTTVLGDGTKPVTVEVFDEDWPDADDLIVRMRWQPSSGPITNQVSYDEADYRVTVRSG